MRFAVGIRTQLATPRWAMQSLMGLCLVFLSFTGSAQNLDAYGMSGQPMALGQNPGSPTDLRFHVSLPGISTRGAFNTPLGSFWGDMKTKIRSLELPQIALGTSTDCELLGMGWKSNYGYTWFQSGLDVDSRIALDKDLLQFGFDGFRDENGVEITDFQRDFSETGLSMAAIGRLSLGHQVEWTDKFRLGASLQIHRLLGGFEWDVHSWEVARRFNPTTQSQSLYWQSEMDVSAFGLIADAAVLDSAVDFPRYLIMAMYPAYAKMVKEQKNAYSFSVGCTYTPTESMTLMASVTGIPLSGSAHLGGWLNSRSLNWQADFEYDGFSPGFSLQDTGSWVSYLVNLQSPVVQSFAFQSAPVGRFNAPFTVQAAAYYSLTKKHKVGVHLAHVDRLAGQQQSFGLEYQGFLSRKLQIAASYRLHTWDGLDGSPELSTLVQHRILPWTSLYVGTNLWLSVPRFQNGLLRLPGNFQSWQVTAGLNLTLFENQTKQERRERKAAKKAAKSALELEKAATSLEGIREAPELPEDAGGREGI